MYFLPPGRQGNDKFTKFKAILDRFACQNPVLIKNLVSFSCLAAGGKTSALCFRTKINPKARKNAVFTQESLRFCVSATLR
jgi:hypothetical protein